jgi:hypothetical protein
MQFTEDEVKFLNCIKDYDPTGDIRNLHTHPQERDAWQMLWAGRWRVTWQEYVIFLVVIFIIIISVY